MASIEKQQQTLSPEVPQSMVRDQVFISYSHADRKWLERLQTMLAPLQRQGALDVWADTRIQPGQLWKEEIQQALVRARIAVLLVSPDFLASEFIHENELPPLLEASRKEGLTIFWVPIRPSLYSETAIAHYQAAHDPEAPLSTLTLAQQETALVVIAKKLTAIRPIFSPTPAPLSATIPIPEQVLQTPSLPPISSTSSPLSLSQSSGTVVTRHNWKFLLVVVVLSILSVAGVYYVWPKWFEKGPSQITLATTDPDVPTTTGSFESNNRAARFAKARFICYNGTTVSGQSVYVVGNIPELGTWDPAKAVKLETKNYLDWTRIVTNLPPNTRIEWKCIKRPDGAASPVVWQPALNSNIVTSPPAGQTADKSWESRSPEW